MVRILAGSFTTGSPKDTDTKPHQVTTYRPFEIGRYPVTQEVWAAVMKGAAPSHLKGPRRPVEQVSWLDALKFCDDLSRLAGLTPSYGGAGDPNQVTGVPTATGCQPRRSGSTPAEPAQPERNMVSSTKSHGTTATQAEAHTTWVRRSPTSGICTTCLGTCVSGAGTPMYLDSLRAQSLVERSTTTTVSSAAGREPTARRARVPRFAASATPSSGSTASASVSPGRLDRRGPRAAPAFDLTRGPQPPPRLLPPRCI